MPRHAVVPLAGAAGVPRRASAPGHLPVLAPTARRRPPAAVRRPARTVRSAAAVDQQQRDRLDEPDDPDRLRRPEVATDRARRGVEHPAGERPADGPPIGMPHPVGDRDPEIRRRRTRRRRPTIRGRGASTAAAGASGSTSAAASDPSPRTTTDGDRDDAAHRRSDEGDPPDPALAEPGQRARDVLDLVQPERRRRVVRAAVAAEVEPEDAGGPAERSARARRDPARRSPSSRGAGGSPRTDRAASRRRHRVAGRSPPAASGPQLQRRRAIGAGRPRRRARRPPA